MHGVLMQVLVGTRWPQKTRIEECITGCCEERGGGRCCRGIPKINVVGIITVPCGGKSSQYTARPSAGVGQQASTCHRQRTDKTLLHPPAMTRGGTPRGRRSAFGLTNTSHFWQVLGFLLHKMSGNIISFY